MSIHSNSSNNKIVNIVLAIVVLIVLYKVWQSKQNDTVEPYSMTYQSSTGPIGTNFQASKNVALGSQSNKNDTSDIYANVPLASASSMPLNTSSSKNDRNKYQSGMMAAGNEDPNKFNLSLIDKDNHTDFASMAGISTQAKLNQKKQSTAPEYTETSDMLPAQDMNNTMMKDPSDPQNYMYDRPIYAQTKAKNRNPSDYLRGDLEIATINRGMFDISTDPSNELTKGYFANYQDLEEQTDIQDYIYNNIASGKTDNVDKITNAAQELANKVTQPDLKFAKWIQ